MLKYIFWLSKKKEKKIVLSRELLGKAVEDLRTYLNFDINYSQLRNATYIRNYQLTDSEILDKVYSKVDKKNWVAKRSKTRYKHRFKANKQFISTIKSFLKGKTLLDFGCGDGTYTESLSNVLYFDTEDKRLNTDTTWYNGVQHYDAVLFRYVLHHTRELEVLLEYARGKMLFIIEHDPRGCEKELHDLHAQYEPIPSDYFNGEMCHFISPKEFLFPTKVIKGGRYNSYLVVYWKYNGLVHKEDDDEEYNENDLDRLEELI